jgi:GT2 family glycosyltransferase
MQSSQPETADSPDATAIVVSYNVKDLVLRCLASIRAAGAGERVEAILVDNASTDGTIEAVRAEFPAVVRVVNTVNRGFGAANNQGIARARGCYLLLINPDAELLPGALSRLVTYADAHPDAGIVGPRLRLSTGEVQPSRRRFPTPLTALVESTVVQRWWPGCPILADYVVADRSPDVAQDVDWLVGACLLVRRAVVEEVGGFDERFFMYSEEIDLCRRARAAGWRVVYLPGAEVLHREGKSSEQNLASRSIRFNESKARYFEKYYGATTGRALRLYLLANTAYDLLVEATKLALGHRPELRRVRVGNLARVARYQVAHLMGENERCASR